MSVKSTLTWANILVFAITAVAASTSAPSIEPLDSCLAPRTLTCCTSIEGDSDYYPAPDACARRETSRWLSIGQENHQALKICHGPWQTTQSLSVGRYGQNSESRPLRASDVRDTPLMILMVIFRCLAVRSNSTQSFRPSTSIFTRSQYRIFGSSSTVQSRSRNLSLSVDIC